MNEKQLKIVKIMALRVPISNVIFLNRMECEQGRSYLTKCAFFTRKSLDEIKKQEECEVEARVISGDRLGQKVIVTKKGDQVYAYTYYETGIMDATPFANRAQLMGYKETFKLEGMSPLSLRIASIYEGVKEENEKSRIEALDNYLKQQEEQAKVDEIFNQINDIEENE